MHMRECVQVDYQGRFYEDFYRFVDFFCYSLHLNNKISVFACMPESSVMLMKLLNFPTPKKFQNNPGLIM